MSRFVIPRASASSSTPVPKLYQEHEGSHPIVSPLLLAENRS